MARLTKVQREQVRGMFDGRCAYCGEALPERWHADHREAVLRELKSVKVDGQWKLRSGKPMRPENDVLENYFPSCPPCNISKHSMNLEQWRAWLAGHLESLNKHTPVYRMVKRYGLIQETGAAVTFYFERVSMSATPQER